MINLLSPLQEIANSDTGIHWIIGSGTLASIIVAAVSFGQMKADNKNNRRMIEDYYTGTQRDLNNHKDDDDDRFKSFDKRLESIDKNTSDIKSWVDQQKGYNQAMKEKEF